MEIDERKVKENLVAAKKSLPCDSVGPSLFQPLVSLIFFFVSFVALSSYQSVYPNLTNLWVWLRSMSYRGSDSATPSLFCYVQKIFSFDCSMKSWLPYRKKQANNLFHHLN